MVWDCSHSLPPDPIRCLLFESLLLMSTDWLVEIFSGQMTSRKSPQTMDIRWWEEEWMQEWPWTIWESRCGGSRLHYKEEVLKWLGGGGLRGEGQSENVRDWKQFYCLEPQCFFFFCKVRGPCVPSPNLPMSGIIFYFSLFYWEAEEKKFRVNIEG